LRFLNAFLFNLLPVSAGSLMCAKNKKPTVKDTVSNLAKPMPLTKKLSLFIKNNTYKLLNFKNCCGHPGEPGC
jgi:hypothetical protein